MGKGLVFTHPRELTTCNGKSLGFGRKPFGFKLSNSFKLFEMLWAFIPLPLKKGLILATQDAGRFKGDQICKVVGTHLKVLSFLCSTRIRSGPLWEYYWYSVFFLRSFGMWMPVLHVQSLSPFGAFDIITYDWRDRDHKNRGGLYS